MRAITITILGTIMFTLAACNASKQAQESTVAATGNENIETKAQTTEDNANMISGIIKKNEDKGMSCEYFIYDNSTKTLFDPINLEKDFMLDGNTVWFTYSRLRMKNRCGNISPIRVESIKKRED